MGFDSFGVGSYCSAHRIALMSRQGSRAGKKFLGWRDSGQMSFQSISRTSVEEQRSLHCKHAQVLGRPKRGVSDIEKMGVNYLVVR